MFLALISPSFTVPVKGTPRRLQQPPAAVRGSEAWAVCNEKDCLSIGDRSLYHRSSRCVAI